MQTPHNSTTSLKKHENAVLNGSALHSLILKLLDLTLDLHALDQQPLSDDLEPQLAVEEQLERVYAQVVPMICLGAPQIVTRADQTYQICVYHDCMTFKLVAAQLGSLEATA